jgi:putative tricarboxylic transport membrane protein
MLHGIQPGPQVLATQSAVVYTVFASLYLGLILMCVIGYFAIRPLVRILDMPEAVVSSYVLILCFIGALSIRNDVTDLWLMIGFGVIGYLFERLKFPIAPLVLGVILGPLAEESFMNAMISFSNDWTVFFTRPISGTIVALTIVVLLLPFVQQLLRRRVATA